MVINSITKVRIFFDKLLLSHSIAPFLWIVGAACLFTIVYYWGAFDGYYGYDDVTYARYAKEVADGVFVTNHQDNFSFRWGIIYPSGWVIRWLGMNDYSLCLVVLLALWSSIVAVGVAFRRLSPIYYVVACLFFVLDYYTLYYSHKLFADTLVAALGTWIVVLTAEVRFSNFSQRRQVVCGMSAALLLWAALLSKETIYFVMPILMYWSVRDIWQRQRLVYWLSLVGVGAVLLALYLTYMYRTFGDPLYRITITEASSYANSCSYHLLPWSVVLRRISYGWFMLLSGNGMAIAVWFAVVGALRHGSHKWWQGNKEQDFYGLSFVILFVSYNFLSITPKYYIPMCLDGRHFLFLIPMAAIAGVQSFLNFCKQGQNRWAVLVILLGIMALAYWDGAMQQLYIYGLLLCWVLLRFFFNSIGQKQGQMVVYITMLAGILLIHPLYVLLKPSYNGQKAARQLVEQHLRPQTAMRHVVITDGIQQAIGELYTQFDTLHYRFVEYRQVPSLQLLPRDSVYLLLNAYSNGVMLSGHHVPLPDYARQIPRVFRRIDQKENVELYAIPHNYFEQEK